MSTITVKAQINDVIHYTLSQNQIPIIEDLVIVNESNKIYNSLLIQISFSPELVVMKEIDIQTLEAGTSITLTPITLIPSMEYLLTLQEMKQGKITIMVKDKDKILCTFSQAITILAYDTLLGRECYKELIAAYCTPNHIGITEVIEHAKKYLNGTKNRTFTGYSKNNTDIVIEQMNVIYNAIQEYEIELTAPDKVVDTAYEKIRFADIILEEKYATAIEIALLFAGCLEHISLNPILIFTEERVIIGCWLHQENFSNKIETDIDLLRGVNENEDKFCLVEGIDVVMNGKTEFWQSQQNANNYINNLKNSFDMIDIIDIRCCRVEGIHSLPMSFGKTIDDKDRTNYSIDIEVNWNSINQKRRLLSQANFENKKQLWEEQLIDLSSKNNLINFTYSDCAIQIATVNLFELQEQLIKEEQFVVVPKNDCMFRTQSSKSLVCLKDHAYVEAYVSAQFKNRKITTCMESDELENHLKHIMRQARQSIEETGTNSLYLALGFLRWYEKPKDEQERYSPLVLVPIEIIRDMENDQYRLFLRDEQTVINNTLLELLQKEYALNIEGISPLPFDECGADLSQVFKSIRKEIAIYDRWALEEAAFISLFACDQYVLYKDIKTQAIRYDNNKIIDSLIKGKLDFKPQSSNALDVKQIVPFIYADHSQLEAIAAANKGESFLLVSPLGSGKSKTITNILAELMKKGKRALVIGKKEASLQAIRQQLQVLGLDPYVLFAFSDYAKRNELLEQFNKVLRSLKAKSNLDHEETTKDLQIIQENMNEVVNAIHRKREYGISFYSAITQYELYKEYKDQLEIDDATIARMKDGDYENWIAAVEQCKYAKNECLQGAGVVFSRYHNTEYSMEIRSSFVSDCREMISELELLQEQYKEIKSLLGLQMKEDTYIRVKTISELLDLIQSTGYLLDEVMVESSNGAKEKVLYEAIRCGKEKNKLENEIKQEFNDEIFEYDAILHGKVWKESMKYWFVKRYLYQRHQVNDLKRYAHNHKNISRLTVQIWLDKLIRYQEIINYLEALPTSITSQFSYIWQGVNTNWDKLEAALTNTIHIRDVCSQLSLERNVYITLAQKLSEMISSPEKERKTSNRLTECYQSRFRKCMVLEMKLTKQYHTDLDYFHESEEWIASTIQELSNWIEHNKELRDWSQYLKQLDVLRELGFANVAKQLYEGEVGADEVVKSFICNVNLAIIKRIMQAEPILINNQGACFEQQLEKYITLTKTCINNESIQLEYQLSSKVRQCLDKEDLTEQIAFLKKMIKTGGKLLNIEDLFIKAQQVIKALFPCMVMSPVAAAKYLDEGYSSFDYVIIEDAFAIETCEAVGAIARGNNVILVGDINQANIENLFEDYSAIGITQRQIRWQYEADETITAFRNYVFYQNQLKTFPSSSQEYAGIIYKHVDGVYDENTGQNLKEAKEIVRMICERLLNSNGCRTSIGVITLNTAQQYLIEDMLEAAYKKYANLMKAMMDLEEPIYVRTMKASPVEARDTIFLSIVYGKETDGKNSMDFGILCNISGENQLNVAIACARKELNVVASIQGEEIDLTRTRSEGVIKLRNLLLYAKHDKSVVEREDGQDVIPSETNTVFVQNIATELKKLGYIVQCNVGLSKNKLDLAIMNPKNGKECLLGVLVYGQREEDPLTVNQDMLLNIDELQKRKWNLQFIWILDWLDNPAKVINKLKERIENLMEVNDLDSKSQDNNSFEDSLIEVAAANI